MSVSAPLSTVRGGRLSRTGAAVGKLPKYMRSSVCSANTRSLNFLMMDETIGATYNLICVHEAGQIS